MSVSPLDLGPKMYLEDAYVLSRLLSYSLFHLPRSTAEEKSAEKDNSIFGAQFIRHCSLLPRLMGGSSWNCANVIALCFHVDTATFA